MKMVMLTVLLIYPLDRILCNYYKDTSENSVMTWVNAHDISIYNYAFSQQTLIDHYAPGTGLRLKII